MSLPNPLFIYKEDGSQTKIVDALRWTRKPVIYSEAAYRDLFNAALMGGAIPNGANGATDSIAGAQLAIDGVTKALTYLTQVPSSIVPSTGVSVVSLSDEIGHYPWRVKQYIRWVWEFWDDVTPGIEMTMSVTTVSGSPIITVPDNKLLTPGQGITGAGIPASTTILSIMPVTEGLPIFTTAVLSQQATASATVAATLSGSNLVGRAFEDEVIDWGAEISFPV